MRLGWLCLGLLPAAAAFTSPAMLSFKLAVIGAGSVGTALGDAAAAGGLEVAYGVRDTASEKTAAMISARPEGTQALEVPDAVTWADAVILATPSAHDDESIQAMAASLGAVDGKVIIDATNPLTPFRDGLQVRWGQDASGGEVLQAALPSAAVYKAFNTIGVEHMSKADGSLIGGERLTMLFCGSGEDGPKQVVERVISSVGFAPVYAGDIRYARNLEAIAELWIHRAIFAGDGRNFHYQVIKAPAESEQ